MKFLFSLSLLAILLNPLLSQDRDLHIKNQDQEKILSYMEQHFRWLLGQTTHPDPTINFPANDFIICLPEPQFSGFESKLNKLLSSMDRHIEEWYQLDQKVVEQFFHQRFTPNERFLLIELIFIPQMVFPDLGPCHYHYAATLSSTMLSITSGNKLLTLKEALFSMKKVVEMASEENVFYDGERGDHTYYNKELQKHTLLLSLKMNQSQLIEDAFLKNPYFKAFLIDTNTIDPKTRIEPFDLLAHLSYKLFLTLTQTFNPDVSLPQGSALKSSFQYALKNHLGFEIEAQYPLSYSLNPKGAIFSCYRPLSYGIDSLFHFDYWTHSHLGSFIGNTEVTKTCNGKNFQFKTVETQDKKLSHPQPLQTQWKDQKTLKITYLATLARDMAKEYLTGLKLILTTMGYKVKSQQVVDTQEYFSEQFSNQTDVLIHAGHSLSPYGFDAGAKQNTLIQFEKKGKNGKKAIIDFLVPTKGYSEYLELSKNQLIDYYTKRLINNQKSLFIFVTSCNSEDNIDIWSIIYRDALKKVFDQYEQRTDFPYVIASERSFDTDNPLMILSHIFYSTDTIEMLVNGKNISDIYHMLKTKEYGGFFEEFSKRINPFKHQNASGLFKRMATNFEKNIKDRYAGFTFLKEKPLNTFMPAYNLSDDNQDRILQLGGRRFQIFDFDSNELLLDHTL